MNHVKDRHDVNSTLPYEADRKTEQTRSGKQMQNNSMMSTCKLFYD